LLFLSLSLANPNARLHSLSRVIRKSRGTEGTREREREGENEGGRGETDRDRERSRFVQRIPYFKGPR
jgi:hypothetical protein